jgi:hypothetical protein
MSCVPFHAWWSRQSDPGRPARHGPRAVNNNNVGRPCSLAGALHCRARAHWTNTRWASSCLYFRDTPHARAHHFMQKQTCVDGYNYTRTTRAHAAAHKNSQYVMQQQRWASQNRASTPRSRRIWILDSLNGREGEKEQHRVTAEMTKPTTCPDVRGKKFVAAGLQTRPFAAPHKNEDRPHLQVNNTIKTLSGGPVGGVYPHFCEGLQTAWFAARLQQIFFRCPSVCFFQQAAGGESGPVPQVGWEQQPQPSLSLSRPSSTATTWPSVLYLQPAAELRRVHDAGDVGPARHQQPRHLRVPLPGVRLGPRRCRSRGSAARLDPPTQERAVGEELVGQVPGQELVVAGGGGGGGGGRASRSRIPRLGSSRHRERLGLQQLALALLALAEDDTRGLQLLAQRHIDGCASPPDTSARS